MITIAFDVGGVLSKYPDVWRPLLEKLYTHNDIVVLIISDMHPREKIIQMLMMNNLHFHWANVYSADYATHGEMCKTVLCRQLGVDIMIDDFPGYVAVGDYVRLLVMPDPTKPYYHDAWVTDGFEGDFGRRKAT